MTFDPIERWNLTLALGAVAVSLVLATPAFAAGLAVGAVLEAVNFRALRRSAELVFSPQQPGRRGWLVGFGARFALLAVGIGAAIYAGTHPVGLVIGLSLIIPAAIIEALRTRPPVLERTPALAFDDEEWERWNPWLAREREDDEPGENW